MLAEANLMIVSVALTDKGVSLPVLLLVKFEQILARDAPGEQPQQLACDEPREGRLGLGERLAFVRAASATLTRWLVSAVIRFCIYCFPWPGCVIDKKIQIDFNRVNLKLYK